MARQYEFEPDSYINVYRFVPLDNTYQNSIIFNSREEQMQYFKCDDNTYNSGIKKFMFKAQTATRNEKQVIRVDHNYADLMDCNYVSFLNKPFATPNPATLSGIWIFAFILNVEYINDFCTEIEFEIDVIQTFMFNYALKECFIEREHSLIDKDEIGDSLTPEPITNLVEKVAKVENTNIFDEYKMIFLTAFDHTDPSLYKVRTISGSVGVYDLNIFAENDIGSIDSWIRQVNSQNKLDDIYIGFLFPSVFANYGLSTLTKEFTPPTDFNGYIPKNNKLFTYPYSYMIIDTGKQEGVYRYEFFEERKYEFGFTGVISQVPAITCIPYGYNGFSIRNPCDMLIMDDFPSTSLAGSAIKAWFAQHGIGATISAGVSVGEIFGGVAIGDPKTAVSGVIGLTNPIDQYLTAANSPAIHKSSSGQFTSTAMRTRNFYAKHMQLTKESAQIVDDFFTMYGYSVQKVKIPNINDVNKRRPLFNYIKCRQMSFNWEQYTNPVGSGYGTSVPQKYMNKIITIYQNGITFWSDPNKVGRYNENNK